MKLLYNQYDTMITWDEEFQFGNVFDRKTGFSVRGDDIWGSDPFMRSYPELIDVGIMGHCKHGVSGLCVRAGIQCYQDGLRTEKPHMSLENYQRIVDESEGKVFQIALGGRGDPNKHPDFSAILQYTTDNNIVPNYTTSGLNLTKEEVSLTAEYCGAVAVSWYRSQYTLDALDAFISAGCTTNIHYVLSRSTISEAIERLEKRNWFGDGANRINAVTFLLHKPVGLGRGDEVLRADDSRVQYFFELVDEWNGDFKIGFDSCSIPGVLNYTSHIAKESIDTCEGARFSMYVSPSMIATPCSFDQSFTYGVDLRNCTIEKAWNSERFQAFRSKMNNKCPTCSSRELCLGGCPLTPEIVLCNKGERL